MFLSVVDAELSDVDVDDVDVRQQYDGKIGTKKLRKLEEKAARKAQREVCNSLDTHTHAHTPSLLTTSSISNLCCHHLCSFIVRNDKVLPGCTFVKMEPGTMKLTTTAIT